MPPSPRTPRRSLVAADLDAVSSVQTALARQPGLRRRPTRGHARRGALPVRCFQKLGYGPRP